MTKFTSAVMAIAMFCSAAAVQAQSGAAPSTQASAKAMIDPSQYYDKAIGNVEHQWVTLAEAMPADKWNFAPSQGEFKGVRTFGEQVKHVAQANMLFYGLAMGQKPSMDEMKASGAITDRAQIIAMLKKSYEVGHQAAAQINAQNAFDSIDAPFGLGAMPRAGLLGMAVAHSFDHYGQSVVYARMNGIVPPATAESQQPARK
ncbi:MAG: hypothetical protein NVS9B15_12330 [Acidobacteriaceae bacterium]